MTLHLKVKSSYKKWRKTAFPLYDDMHCLVVGTIATGNMAFRPGRDFTPNGSEANSEFGATADASQPTDESQATVMIDWPESPQRHSVSLLDMSSKMSQSHFSLARGERARGSST